MQRFLFVLWIAFLAILPFNLTFYLGIEHFLPADLLAPLLVISGAFVFRREIPALLKRDRAVLVYLALFLLTGFVAVRHAGLQRPLAVALAAQIYLAVLYMAFRAQISVRSVFRRILSVWAVISTFYALVGIAGVLLGHLGLATPLARWYPDLGPGLWRMIGTLGHSPNFVFSYLFAGFFICLGLYLKSREPGFDIRIPRRFLFGMTAIHALALLLTYSRGILGVLLGIAVILQARRNADRAVRAAIWSVLAALFIYSGVFFTYTTDALFTPSRAAADSLHLQRESPHRRLYSYKNVLHLEGGERYTRLPGGLTFLPAQHWYLLEISWRLFRGHPFIGVGPGLYTNNLASLRDSGSMGLPPGLPDLKPHSTFFGALAEQGLTGFAALALLWMFMTGVGKWHDIERDSLSLVLHAGAVGWLLVGLNVDIMNFRWLWLYLALVVASRESGPAGQLSK